MATPSDKPHPPIYIADDGEMEQIRALLRDQQLPFSDVGSAPDSERMELLISNPRTALGFTGSTGGVVPDVHIVVARKLSRTMRQQLQRSSCDFIVEGPMDPSALQLLIRHALYRGPERRSADRVPLGVPVKIKCGWRQRNATLLQLSMRGCGIAIRGKLSDGGLAIRLPSEYCDGQKVELPARVLEDMGSSEGEHILALGFTRLSAEARAVLERAMRVAAGARGQLKPGRRAPARVAEVPHAATGALAGSRDARAREDRRVAERVGYRRRLLGTTSGRAQVVIGHDLSMGGMRVAPDPELGVGDVIKLALHGGGKKVLVQARVIRDAGSDGLGLSFIELGEKAKAGLAGLIESLEIVGRPLRKGDARPTVVVSEVLESDGED